MARLTRVEQARANRERILASAREHFEHLGYHGASVDAIAEHAGFSKGAIYSQFGSKDELMLAVLEASIEERDRATQRFAETLGADARIEDVMREAFSVSLGTRAWQAALTEFRIHAWRQPELNERYRALHERTVEKVASVIDRVLAESDVEDRRARDLAVAMLAVNAGLVVESLSGSRIDADEFVGAVGSWGRAEPTATKGGSR